MHNTSPITGASLESLIHGCQTPTLCPKADVKPQFLGDFKHLSFKSRGAKKYLLKLMVAMAPVAPMIKAPLYKETRFPFYQSNHFLFLSLWFYTAIRQSSAFTYHNHLSAQATLLTLLSKESVPFCLSQLCLAHLAILLLQRLDPLEC